MDYCDIDMIKEDFINRVRDCSEITEYRRLRREIMDNQDMKEKVVNFRNKSMQFQEMDNEHVLENIEKFEEEYDNMVEDPLLRGFMEAEAAACRLIREINEELTALVEISLE